MERDSYCGWLLCQAQLHAPCFFGLGVLSVRVVTQSLDSIIGVVFDRYAAAAATPLPSLIG